MCGMKLETQEKINKCIDAVEMAYLAGCALVVVACLVYSFCF